MINELKSRVFSGWHLIRWIVLAAGIFLLWQALYLWDGLLAVLGTIFLLQGITGSGCFASKSCGISGIRKKAKEFKSHEVDENSLTDIKKQ